MPDDWFGGSRRNVLRNILGDERGREVNYDQGVGGVIISMMHMAFMKPDEYSVSHLKCVYVYVYDCFFFSFSRESPSEKIRVACGKTNQRKLNGTGGNGRARRFAMVLFFFFLIHSIPHCHSHITWYFFM